MSSTLPTLPGPGLGPGRVGNPLNQAEDRAFIERHVLALLAD